MLRTHIPIVARRLTALFAAVIISLSAGAHADEPVRTDTPSGYPVPRFVSLKSGKTNCRIGPSLDHPKMFTFTAKALPVMVIAETTDNWRKVRDRTGDECWVHASLLSGAQTAEVTHADTPVHVRARPDARIRARLGAGVIARVSACTEGWCRVQVNGIKGWVETTSLWGWRG